MLPSPSGKDDRIVQVVRLVASPLDGPDIVLHRETGEHIELPDKTLQYIPFPVCNETGQPLTFHYGIEGEINCTISFISDSFFHLLEFYIHSDAPMSCRLPARPPPHKEIIGHDPPPQQYVPLVFALAGTLQRSHVHVSTHLNVLLHSTRKHHLKQHDSGILDSAAAYSTSPLSNIHATPHDRQRHDSEYLESPYEGYTRRVIIGDPLPLSFSVRWFPSPQLPKIEGRFEWRGMGGHVYASTVFYCLLSFLTGACVAAVYFFSVVLPKRLRSRNLGGATPLGYGLSNLGNGKGQFRAVGNGWGVAKRMD